MQKYVLESAKNCASYLVRKLAQSLFPHDFNLVPDFSINIFRAAHSAG